MSGEYDHDDGVACCHCASCMALSDGGIVGDGRYTIPNGPTIPSGPTIPNGPTTIPSGPTIPDPPTIPTAPTSPTTPSAGSGTDTTGYTGPRFHTLLRGDDWNGAAVATPTVVMYSFATRSLSNYATTASPGYAGFNPAQSEALDASQRASIRQALSLWEDVSGLFFIEVPDQPELNFNGIRFSMENLNWLDIPGVVGYAMPNYSTYGFNIQFNSVYYADDPLRMGTDPFVTAMHEIGHAIGLKHPFHGTPNLSAAEDNTSNTVMSYTNGGNFNRLGQFDVDAVQHIYGTQRTEASAPVRWSHGSRGSLVSTGNDAANVITGLFIRDVVFGGGGDDLIHTLGGNDEITPGAGNDAVFGGAGSDVLDTGVLRQQAVLAIGPGRGTVALPDGTDTFYDVETLRFIDGDLVLGGNVAAGQVYRLYGAALGRAPDAVGLAHWTSAVEAGAITLAGASAGFIASSEFGGYASQTNAGFVSLLYANVLGRAPDAAGLEFWTGTMRAGQSRADVLLAFSESAEYRQKTDAVFSQGIWVPDQEAVDVVRAYLAVLDRLPDAGGLAHWTVAREAGLAQHELVERFVSSAEFQARFGGLSNREFVEQLYRTSLDREADAAGLSAWTQVLDAGTDSRAGVALGFSGSAEMTAKITPLVEHGEMFV